MKDEILEELWKVKDQIATEVKCDPRLLFARLKIVQQKAKNRIVNRTHNLKKATV